MHTNLRKTIGSGFVVMMFMVACSGVSNQPSGGTAPRVYFVEPTDGATVSSPVKVKMAAQNFKIEPAGDIHNGAGHLHILVDADCIAANQVIPKDDAHLHYGKGQVEAELDLKPGTHRLCLQAGNGAHQVIAGNALIQTINITVK